jgi:hypothetical protein
MHLSRKAIVALLPMFMFGVAARAWSADSDQAITMNAQITHRPDFRACDGGLTRGDRI